MTFDVDFFQKSVLFFCGKLLFLDNPDPYGVCYSGTLIYFFVKCIYCIHIPPGIVSIMWKIPGQRRKEDTICPIIQHARRASFFIRSLQYLDRVYFWYFFVPWCVSVFINDLDERGVASVQEVKIYAIPY